MGFKRMRVGKLKRRRKVKIWPLPVSRFGYFRLSTQISRHFAIAPFCKEKKSMIGYPLEWWYWREEGDGIKLGAENDDPRGRKDIFRSFLWLGSDQPWRRKREPFRFEDQFSPQPAKLLLLETFSFRLALGYFCSYSTWRNSLANLRRKKDPLNLARNGKKSEFARRFERRWVR